MEAGEVIEILIMVRCIEIVTYQLVLNNKKSMCVGYLSLLLVLQPLKGLQGEMMGRL